MNCTVSFIVAVRDEPQHLLEATIDGLLQTSMRYRIEIVIVDDGSLVPLTLERPEVVIIRNNEPIGSARSRRTGATLETAKFSCFWTRT